MLVLSSRVSTVCHFKCLPFFFLHVLKVMNVFEMPRMLQTSPIPLYSGRLVHCEALSPSLQGLFQLFNQQHWGKTKSSWASPDVYGINHIHIAKLLLWGNVFVLLGYLNIIFRLSHRTCNEIFTMAAILIQLKFIFCSLTPLWKCTTLCLFLWQWLI